MEFLLQALKKAQLIISQILNGEFIKKQALKDEYDPLLITINEALEIYIA